MTTIQSDSLLSSPLEEFLRDYAEVAGGLWDEIEPQVYDLMLPGRDAGERAGDGATGLRSRGDPRASRRAACQLRDAAGRSPAGRCREPGPAHRAVHGRLEPRAAGPGGSPAPRGHVAVGIRAEARAIAAAAFSPGGLLVRGDVRERPEGARPADGGDRRAPRPAGAPSGPPARPLAPGREALVAAGRGAARRAWPTAYPIARDRVVRTLSALANTYHRELHERLDRQLERIGRYYGDLRAEVEEQAQKARNRDEDPARFTARLEALEREEAVAQAPSCGGRAS